MLSLEQLKNKVKEEKEGFWLTKDGFDVRVNCYDDNGGFEVFVDFNDEFYDFDNWISDTESLHEYIKNLSTDSEFHLDYLKKKELKEEIQKGLYKDENSKKIETPSDEFIRIYRSKEESEYKFNEMIEYLEDNLNKNEIFDNLPGKQITVAKETIDRLKELGIFKPEIALIESLLAKRTCNYCRATVINASYVHYTGGDLGGVGRDHICPDCLDLYDAKLIQFLGENPNGKNRDRIEAASYIFKKYTK